MKQYKIWIQIESYDSETDQYDSDAVEPLDVDVFDNIQNAIDARNAMLESFEGLPVRSRPEGRKQTPAELTEELNQFCEENDYEKICAAELLSELQFENKGGEAHIEWLKSFINRWEAATQ